MKMHLRVMCVSAAIAAFVLCTGGPSAAAATAKKKQATKSQQTQQSQDNLIDIRLTPSAMSGWEVFHLTDAQNALTPFPILLWTGGGNAAAGNYAYTSLSGGVGGYKGVRYDAQTGSAIVKSDIGVWTNAGTTRYFCARKRIQLTGTPKTPVSVSLTGHADDTLHLFLRNASGQVTELCRTPGGAGSFSCSADFSRLKKGTNWVELYATDAVFTGTAAKRHISIDMTPVSVSVSSGGGGGGGGTSRHK